MANHLNKHATFMSGWSGWSTKSRGMAVLINCVEQGCQTYGPGARTGPPNGPIRPTVKSQSAVFLLIVVLNVKILFCFKIHVTFCL